MVDATDRLYQHAIVMKTPTFCRLLEWPLSELIEVQGLTKYFGTRPAIVDLTFSVPKGQVLGFLGPNGAGKSTTVRILTGYLGATSGSAAVAGYDLVKQSRDARKRIGYLSEKAPLYNEMGVERYLETMCRLRGVAPRNRRLPIDYALAACGLAERRRDIIGNLSSELRRRVGLAQAVVHDPQVLILDEPTAGLEPAERGEARQLISVLGKQRTVILSSRTLSEVSATCERVVLIKDGKLVADEAPGTLSRRLGDKRNRQVEAVVVGDPLTVDKQLRELAGVMEVTMTSNGDGERHLTVIGQRDDLQEAVAKLIVGEGLSLRSLNSHSLFLEDLHLKLTSEEAS
jgi:ABC-2 type transport system ATP-binding protein